MGLIVWAAVGLFAAAPQDARNLFKANFEAILNELAEDDPETRVRARNALDELLLGNPELAFAAVREALSRGSDPEVRTSLISSTRLLPPLKLTLEIEGEAKVGRPIAFRVRIQNQSLQPQIAARFRTAPGDSAGFPRILCHVESADSFSPRITDLRVHDPAPLAEEDFVLLRPLESFDPFDGRAPATPDLAGFTPEAPGLYVAHLSIDCAEPDPFIWEGRVMVQCQRCHPVPPRHPMGELVDRVPKLKVKGRLEFQVAP
ncbi:MAG TPA: hypothetical protein VI643_06970 [Planctomycetota bacterium]|nr:hypothetical protein [Planctomycetota bacterium]